MKFIKSFSIPELHECSISLDIPAIIIQLIFLTSELIYQSQM